MDAKSRVSRRKVGDCAAVLLFFLSSLASVLADGLFFPERAYPKPPAIPTQRALLTYKDGVETLVIESSLDARGQSFGWIIPLPTEPTEFRKVSPGLLKTLWFNLGPDVTTHVLDEWATAPLLFACALTVAAFVAVTFGLNRKLWLLLVALVLSGAVVLSVALTGGHRATAPALAVTPIEGVVVRRTAVVGSYEVSVLKADSVRALNAWLGTNGLVAVPKKGADIVRDYIKKGWCLVATKLRREGSGLSTPHPLLMRFAVRRPLYPIRLTAVAGSDVHLDLFVCADRRAEDARLTTEYCDWHAGDVWRDGRPVPGDLVGEAFGVSVAHPAAKDLLWPGCVLTRLSADLKPTQMEDDLRLKLVPYEPYQRRLYSHAAALEAALGAGLLVWCVCLVGGVLLFNKRIRAERGRLFALLKFFPALLLISAVGAGILYLVLPKTEVIRGGNWHAVSSFARRLGQEGAGAVQEYPADLPWTPDAVALYLEERFSQWKLANLLTREPITIEDSPGNFTVIEDEGTMVLQMYLMDGSVTSTVLERPTPGTARGGPRQRPIVRP